MLELGAALAQLAAYVGVIVAVGAVLAELTLRAPASGVIRARLLAVAGASVTIIATLASLSILMVRIGGGLDADTFALVWETNVGTAAAMRAGGAAILLASVPLAAKDLGRIARLAAAILIATSFNYVGHSAAHSEAGGFAAAMHVTLAAWWVGSLFVLRSVSTQESLPTYAQLVERFSRLAVVAITLMIIAGIAMVWWLARPFAWTAYVLWLSAKIAFALTALALASYNKLRLTPRLRAHDGDAKRALDQSIVLELAVIAMVLLVTAILTTYHSPAQ